MRIIGISEDSCLVLAKGIGADGEPIPKQLTPEQMREARAVTVNRTTGAGALAAIVAEMGGIRAVRKAARRAGGRAGEGQRA